MIRRLCATLAFTCLCHAELATNWIGAGGGYSALSAPPASGWLAMANLVSAPAQLYAFTCHNVTSSKTKPYTIQTTETTGLATVIRTFGPVAILGFGQSGVAASGTSVGGAFSGGGVGVIRLGKTNWTLVLSVEHLKTSIGGTQDLWKFGAGRAW